MPKFYITIGDNLSFTKMAHRCPTAVPVGTAVLKGFTLNFRGMPLLSDLTLDKDENSSVTAGVWLINDEDEDVIDAHEGYPDIARKMLVKNAVITCFDGGIITSDAFFYIVDMEWGIHTPSRSYVADCCKGYTDFGLDPQPLIKASQRAAYTGLDNTEITTDTLKEAIK